MRILRNVLCTVCAMGIGLAGAVAPAETGEPLRVTFVDVGKGDCILLSRDGHHVLIDTGYAVTAGEMAAALAGAGADRLDALILTHYDRDHIGGTEAVLSRFSVDQIWLPGYTGDGKNYAATLYTVERSGIPATRVTEDVSFTFAGVEVEIFATRLRYVPGSGKDEGNDNDVSLVVTARYGKDTLLFAGDIEKEGISSYLAAGHGTFDVVKMPHHGQNESNTDDFVDQVGMKIAVITDSAEESVKKKVIKLINGAGAELYTSAQNGQITVICHGDGNYEVQTER